MHLLIHLPIHVLRVLLDPNPNPNPNPNHYQVTARRKDLLKCKQVFFTKFGNVSIEEYSKSSPTRPRSSLLHIFRVGWVAPECPFQRTIIAFLRFSKMKMHPSIS